MNCCNIWNCATPGKCANASCSIPMKKLATNVIIHFWRSSGVFGRAFWRICGQSFTIIWRSFSRWTPKVYVAWTAVDNTSGEITTPGNPLNKTVPMGLLIKCCISSNICWGLIWIWRVLMSVRCIRRNSVTALLWKADIMSCFPLGSTWKVGILLT